MKLLLKTILYLTLTISFFGCRKPIKGGYDLKFTSQSGYVRTMTCDIYKEKRVWHITERKTQYNSYNGHEGTLDFSRKSFSGELNDEDIPPQKTFNSSYKLTGTSSRKKLTGTYESSSSGITPGVGSYSNTDSGTFEMTLQE